MILVLLLMGGGKVNRIVETQGRRWKGKGGGSNFARRGFQASLSVTGQAAVDGGGGALSI